ncbi:MAG TPA: hypothetical protein VFE57_09305 [Cyclobacteriaceae bacterium]|jgi:hypothetical protein|nr:hypothetical protein [Cyclobacteriaceae bacterium]
MPDKTERELGLIAIVISIIALVFTGLQWWEAHKTRVEASALAIEALHYNQRVYVTAEARLNKAYQPTVSIRASGSSPASNLIYTLSCTTSKTLEGALKAEFSGSFETIDSPEGNILSPGSVMTYTCFPPTKSMSKTNLALYIVYKGSINYKDIFHLPHKSSFCFYSQFLNVGSAMEQCESGNSAD